MKRRLMQRLKNGAAALLMLGLAAALRMPCAAAADGRVVRVAFPQAAGFTYLEEDGARAGVVVDFLTEIAKFNGWQYEYVDIDGDDLLEGFANGQFDLMGGAFWSEDLETCFAYPDYNCGYTRCVLLARRDDERIRSYDLRSLNGKTIGVYERAEENIRRLQEYLAIHALDCTLRYYTHEEMMENNGLFDCLDRGEIDLLLRSGDAADTTYYVAASFDSRAHYLVVPPDEPEMLAELNMALELLYDADPHFAQKSAAVHFPDTVVGLTTFNERELAYIARQKRVTVAVPDDWHPLFCLDNSDAHDGIVPDLLNRIEVQTGLRFDYLRCANYAAAIAAVQQNKADALGFFIGENEDAAAQGLVATAPYLEMAPILVRSKSSSYPDEGLSGAVLEGRTLPPEITAAQLQYYPDAVQALRDVNRGRLDFFYGLSSHVEYITQKETMANVVQVSLNNQSVHVAFALPGSAPTELLTILSKAVNRMTEDEKTAINNRNIVSIGEPRLTLARFVYGDPLLALSIVAAFLLLLMGVIVLAFRSRLRAMAVRAELARAEADSRAKTVFLSRMSHEIRTPMNAIVGFAEVAAGVEGVPREVSDALRSIEISAHHLLGLINDILDMSRIESGRMELASEAFSLDALLNGIESMMAGEARRRGLQFQLVKDVQDNVLVGDEIRLRQVLLNLLSNAFKFTPAGGAVWFEVKQLDAAPDRAAFAFEVKDSGTGIAQQDQHRIFHRFEQAGTAASKAQGTGLGLPICEHIVRLMGGEITLRSAPGQGSCFRFVIRLPRGRAADIACAGRTAPTGQALAHACILLVEDNELNAQIAMTLLRKQGAQVCCAQDGRAAVALFEDSAPGSIDAILMDVLMPEMDGLDATRAIRALPRQDAKTVPIIAMTANAFKEDKAQAMAAGMNDFLTKPINAAQLYDALRRAIARRGDGEKANCGGR